MLVSGNSNVGVGEQQCWCRGTCMLVSADEHSCQATSTLRTFCTSRTLCTLRTVYALFARFLRTLSSLGTLCTVRTLTWRACIDAFFDALFTHFLRTFYALLVHFLRTLRNLPSLLALYAIFAHFLCPLRTVPSLGTLCIVRTLTWRACTNAFLTHFLRTFCALFLRTFCARFTHLLRTHFLRTFYFLRTFHFLRTFYALLRTFCALFTRFTQFRHAPFACATWRAWRMHRRIFAALVTHFLRTLYALFRHFLRTLYALCALYPDNELESRQELFSRERCESRNTIACWALWGEI